MSIDVQTEIRNGSPNGMRSIRRQTIWNVTGGACFYCLCTLLPDDLSSYLHPLYMTVDHKIPQRLGGSDLLHNVVPCCRSCNSNKGPKTIDEYRIYLFELGRINFFFGEPCRSRDWLILAPLDPRDQVAA